MTFKMAHRIKFLRAGPVMHSWRRIAEIICEEFPEETESELSGNQLYGKELCKDAMEFIYGEWSKIPEDVFKEWDG